MTRPPNVPDAVIEAFAGIPARLEAAPRLVARGRLLDCECRLGPMDHPFYATFRAGRIVDLAPAPILMRSWRFSYRATAEAWAEYWQPVPRPGWHDLFALTKRGEAVLEGDLHPFLAHLQYFKDVLALPRPQAAGAPASMSTSAARAIASISRKMAPAFRWSACTPPAPMRGSGGISWSTPSSPEISASSPSTCPGMASPIRRQAGAATNTASPPRATPRPSAPSARR
jgi:hypothetical protein